MLPSYVSSAQQEKMMRHGYGASNGHTTGGGGAFAAERGYSIKPHKYDKYQPRNPYSTSQQRRQMLLRVGAAVASFLCLILFIFPSLRPTSALPVLSLGLFDADEAFELETVRYYDLSNVGGTSRGWERNERILLCAPLRDASPHLPMFFSHLKNLTYPHNLIDLAFLVGDSKDETLTILSDLLADLQAAEDPTMTFGEISVLEKDFGQTVDQDVESRHGFAAQASRRKSMAQARNWLLSASLRPTHSWVYWRDVDVETAPFTILEDLMRHNKDIIVPNVWRPLPDWLGGEQPYDLNSWQESETALALAETLDEDAVIVEGYAEYATWRPHLAYLRDPYGDPDMEMEIDGVGGVSILAKARVFRAGVHFPAFSFEKHAETEGFGKMAKRMQFSVVGLPHYTIWHMYEPSVDDIRRMEEMEDEKREREAEEKARRERVEKIQTQFDDTSSQWEKDKESLREMSKQEETKKADDAEKPVTSPSQDEKRDDNERVVEKPAKAEEEASEKSTKEDDKSDTHDSEPRVPIKGGPDARQKLADDTQKAADQTKNTEEVEEIAKVKAQPKAAVDNDDASDSKAEAKKNEPRDKEV